MAHTAFPLSAPHGMFFRNSTAELRYPIKVVEIDWDRLIAKRSTVLEKVQGMPSYLLYPEVLELLSQEKNSTYRLILDLMWTAGAKVSELLALRPNSFRRNGNNIEVELLPLRDGPGRPSKKHHRRSPARHIPLNDALLLDRIACYLEEHPRRPDERMFTMTRQTINRRIHTLVERVGDAPFKITASTFRHSFAIHLILHGRPLRYVSQLLGHKSISTTEIYTNVLTIEGGHFLEGVDFH